MTAPQPQPCPHCGQVPAVHLCCGCAGSRQALRAAGRCEICGDMLIPDRTGRVATRCPTLTCRAESGRRRFANKTQEFPQ